MTQHITGIIDSDRDYPQAHTLSMRGDFSNTGDAMASIAANRLKGDPVALSNAAPVLQAALLKEKDAEQRLNEAKAEREKALSIIEQFNRRMDRYGILREQVEQSAGVIADMDGALEQANEKLLGLLTSKSRETFAPLELAKDIYLTQGALPILKEAHAKLEKQVVEHLKEMRSFAKHNQIDASYLPQDGGRN